MNHLCNSNQEKFGEELSAAVALTTLGVSSNRMMNNVLLPEARQLLTAHHQRGGLLCPQQHQNPSLLYPSSYFLGTNPTAPIITNRKLKSANVKRNFPQKLFDLLQVGFHSDVVKWLPGGTAFIVVDKRRFTNEILPNYFKDSQYTSFTRKLSRWKFTRVSRGPYIGAYYHKHFRSDNRALCKMMSCNDGKGKGKIKVTKAGEPVDEPSEETEKRTEAPTDLNKTDIVSSDSVVAEEKEQEQHATPAPPPAVTSSSSVIEQRGTPFTATSGEQASHSFLEQALQLQSSMQSTNNNIQLIKQQLLEIRLRKARVEKKKKLLLLQAEADRLEEISRIKAQANRVRDLNRIKTAISLATRQNNESHIIAAAARALDRCIMDRQASILPNEALSFHSLPLGETAQLQQNNMNNHMKGNRQRNQENESNGRAFAA